jgi:iron complex transport system substrate-binding protein
VLERPAERIISLSPHITELLFSAGAGGKIVATDSGSNFPDAALKIKKIGNPGQLDYETILALKPDLVVGWLSGNRAETISRLKKLGLNVFLSEPQKLADIATNIRRLGRLAGTSKFAEKSASRFISRLNKIERDYRDKKPVSVFYLLWHKPMLTINRTHIINDVLGHCGGENVFSELPAYTPSIDLESVMLANPEVILTAAKGNKRPAWMDTWKKWQQITAVKNNHLFWLNPDWIHRQTPRMLNAVEKVCNYLDKVRQKN